MNNNLEASTMALNDDDLDGVSGGTGLPVDTQKMQKRIDDALARKAEEDRKAREAKEAMWAEQMKGIDEMREKNKRALELINPSTVQIVLPIDNSIPTNTVDISIDLGSNPTVSFIP